MKLSDIREILSERDLQLSKSLGQNFLHDSNQLRRIVAAAEITPGDKILEIGPGLGPLTELLLENGNDVLAIEKDVRLFEYLRQAFDGNPHLELLHDDALQYVKNHRAWTGWKLVSNLPYSVASPILVELAQAENPPDRLVATLQLEVAQRINAPTDDEHYGILSLLLQLVYETRGWFKIPASCFFPVPEVDSACITLVRRPHPLLPQQLHAAFARIVKCGFSQRRKMMFKLLKQNWPEARLAAAFQTLGLSPQIRAEATSLLQFINLTEILSSPAGTKEDNPPHVVVIERTKSKSNKNSTAEPAS
jgi:16S rRNA (adenine1518-N6/adenine1519-N6)-dimethyltransferase